MATAKSVGFDVAEVTGRITRSMAASLLPGLGAGSASVRARSKSESAPRAKSQKKAPAQKVAMGGHSTIPQFLDTQAVSMDVDAVEAPTAAAAPLPAPAPAPVPVPATAALTQLAQAQGQGQAMDCDQAVAAKAAQPVAGSAQASAEEQTSEELAVPPAVPAPRPSSHKDIDVAVAQDVCFAVPYVRDIYAHNRRLEARVRPNQNYMEETQIDITPTMRGILVDWLVEVAEEYRLVPDSLYLSVAYIDRFLSKVSVVRSKLQLVGVTCMLLASKYEEIYAPQVRDFCFITDNTYKEKEVIEMEQRVLDTLDYNLTQPTVRTFLRRFLRAAVRGGEGDSKLESMASFLAELSLLDYGMIVFCPSQVAASAIIIALYVLEQPVWHSTLEHYTGYRPEELEQCVTTLYRVYRTNRGSALPAIREKYNKLRFKCVSSITPPSLGGSLLAAFQRGSAGGAATGAANKRLRAGGNNLTLQTPAPAMAAQGAVGMPPPAPHRRG